MGPRWAANQPESAVSSRYPRTTTPQFNPPIRWQVNHLDLAYNDEVKSPGRDFERFGR